LLFSDFGGTGGRSSDTHCPIRSVFLASVFVPFRGGAGFSEIAEVLLLEEEPCRMGSPAYFQRRCQPRKHE